MMTLTPDRIEFHDVANIFPLMSADEYAALVADMRDNGQREPIWTHEGKIIDGRNRYRACKELGLTPILREWDGNGSLVAFVVSLNLHRRHLNSSQRAVIGLEVEKALAVEARRQQGQRTDLLQKIEKSPSPIHAAAQAATLVGSNRQYISDAKRITRDAPDVLDAVRNGTVAIPDAKRIASLPEPARAALLTRVENGAIKPKDIQDEVRAVRRTLPPPPRQAPILPLPDTVRLEVADATSLPLPDESVDLIVTSPPYGVGKDYARYTDPSEAWYEFMQQWLNEAYRVARPTCRLAVNVPLDTSEGGHRPTYAQLVRAATIEGWQYETTIVWNEGNVSRSVARGSVDSAAAPHIMAPVEMIAVFCKEVWGRKASTPSDLTRDEWLTWTNGLWTFNGEGRAWEGHPAAFPIELPRRLIKLLSFPGDTVLDPFVGSGTTVLEAWRLGRVAIGTDHAPEYIESSKRRLTAAQGVQIENTAAA